MGGLRTKHLFVIAISLCLVLTPLAPGCGTPPQAPTVDLSSPPSPSASGGSTASFDITKAPRLGEEVELTFTIDVTGPIKPVNKVWLEFERYDPAQWYPLGKGKVKERALESLAEKSDPTSPRHVHLMEAANEQPETEVPQSEFLVSGNLSWEGAPLKEGDQVRLNTVVRFPEEGEWLVNGWWGEEGQPAYIRHILYLTVTTESGMFRWPEVYSKGGEWKSPNEHYPVSVTMKPSRAPLLGETFQLTVILKSIEDLPQAEAYLVFQRRGETRRVKVSPDDVLVEGAASWKGSLKKGVPVEFACTVVFPEEGFWEIGGWSRANPESISGNMQSIFLTVGKDESRFDWVGQRE